MEKKENKSFMFNMLCGADLMRFDRAVKFGILTDCPGPSITPGRFGKNEDSCSFTFFPLNLLYECSRP